MKEIAREYDPAVPIDALHEHERNARQGDIGAITQSLDAHGFYSVVIAQKSSGAIIAGAHRWKAAKAKGLTTLPVIWLDVDDRMASRIRVADNRTSDLATDDLSILSGVLADLEKNGGLAGTGFDADDLDSMLAQFRDPLLDADEVPEPPETAVTKVGDLYVMGEHRLLCGDSAKVADLDRLIAGATIAAVLTDPPYGIDLDTDYRSMGTGSDKAFLKGVSPKQYRKVVGDDRPFDATALRAYFAKVKEQFWFGGDYYRRTLSDSDLDGAYLVWDKRNEDSDKGFGSGFELIWSAQKHKRDLLRHYFFGAFGTDARDRVHPTQKPVPLLVEIIRRWVPPVGVVVDPFGGSGSTLIAAEQEQRTAYLMEIDPRYCDVIVGRWENATKRKAVRA